MSVFLGKFEINQDAVQQITLDGQQVRFVTVDGVEVWRKFRPVVISDSMVVG